MSDNIIQGNVSFIEPEPAVKFNEEPQVFKYENDYDNYKSLKKVQKFERRKSEQKLNEEEFLTNCINECNSDNLEDELIDEKRSDCINLCPLKTKLLKRNYKDIFENDFLELYGPCNQKITEIMNMLYNLKYKNSKLELLNIFFKTNLLLRFRQLFYNTLSENELKDHDVEVIYYIIKKLKVLYKALNNISELLALLYKRYKNNKYYFTNNSYKLFRRIDNLISNIQGLNERLDENFDNKLPEQLKLLSEYNIYAYSDIDPEVIANQIISSVKGGKTRKKKTNKKCMRINTKSKCMRINTKSNRKSKKQY